MQFQEPDSSSHSKFLERATELAKLSDCKFQHGAIIRKSGRTMAVGINRRTNNPQFLEDHDAKYNSSVHAEVAAIRACKKSDLRGAIIYVARVNKHGSQMMSKPCEACQKALKAAGIRKVYYTIDSSLNLD